MATRKYKKIQSKTKKMKGSGNTTSSSKNNDSNKKNNSQDNLDLLEKGELGNLNLCKIRKNNSSSIKQKKNPNCNSITFKNFMNSIKHGNSSGAVKFGGSGKPTSKSNSKSSTRKSPSYEDQKKTLEGINRTLKKELEKLNINKNSSLKDIAKADDTNRYIKDVKKLEEINKLLKELNLNKDKKGGKRVRKTRKYKR